MMLAKIITFARRWLGLDPVSLAIVRRYKDANGNNVGELYRDGRMIGMSLDSFPLDLVGLINGASGWLDTEHDFLAPMPPGKIRVGALDPRDNDRVRRMVGRLPKRRMGVTLENRFVEHVLGKE